MSAVRTDAFGLVAITGLVDGGYIFLAELARSMIGSRAGRRLLQRMTGCALVGAGVAVAAR